MVLDTSLLNTQYYKVRIKGKMNNPGNGVSPSPTPRRSSYLKETPRVALNNTHIHTHTPTYIYIYIYISNICNIKSASEENVCGLFIYKIYEKLHVYILYIRRDSKKRKRHEGSNSCQTEQLRTQETTSEQKIT